MATTVKATTLYSSAEAADKIGITESLVCRYCRLGRIKARRIGRSWIITKEALDDFKKRPREVGNPSFKSG